ncbi:MAG: N-acetylmuramoyl-L-alanine amidase, partial [Coprococcus sp.]
MATKIMIDAGHGGFDNGATYEGRTEKADNLNLALALGDALSRRGFDVEYTRTTDVYDSPTRKAQMANEAGADYLISLHRNSASYPNQYNGVQTLVYEDSGVQGRLARAVNSELEKLGFK